MGTTDRQRPLPAAGSRYWFLGRALIRRTKFTQKSEEGLVGFEGQRWQFIQGEVSDFLRIVAGFQSATHDCSAEPDTHGEFGGIVEVGCDEDRLTNGDLEAGFLQQLAGGRFSDIFAVVDVSRRYRPQPRLGSPRTASDHENPTVFVLDQGCHPNARIPEVDVAARGTDRAIPAADRL